MTRTATLAAALLLIQVAMPIAGAHAKDPTQTSTRAATAIDPLVARWAKAWNTDDAASMADLFTERGTYEDLAFQVAFSTPEGVAQWLEITSRAIPDASVVVEDTFRSKNRIAVRWTFSGTPVAFGSTKGTGRSYSVPVLTVMELHDGRIVRATDAYNLADVLR